MGRCSAAKFVKRRLHREPTGTHPMYASKLNATCLLYAVFNKNGKKPTAGIYTCRALARLNKQNLSSEDATSLRFLVHVKAAKLATGLANPPKHCLAAGWVAYIPMVHEVAA